MLVHKLGPNWEFLSNVLNSNSQINLLQISIVEGDAQSIDKEIWFGGIEYRGSKLVTSAGFKSKLYSDYSDKVQFLK